MEAVLKALLLGSHGLGAYAIIFGVLVACGLGVPLPEDISLLLGGYLAYQGAVRFSVMAVVGFAGILAGDSLIYWAGRRVAAHGRSSPLFQRLITAEKRAKVEELFARHGEKIVMIARFMPGVRAVTYFTAGTARMRYWRFAFFDGLAALASAPIFVFLGYRFGGHLEALIHKLKEGQLRVFGVLAVGGLIYYFVARPLLHARRAKAAALAASSSEAGPRSAG